MKLLQENKHGQMLITFWIRNGNKNICIHSKLPKYSQLRWFQIRINHNILVTNKLLHHMNITDDSSCTFCTTMEETIIHLLWSCSKTQDFLNLTISWFESFDIHIKLSEKLFLFGVESLRDQKLTKYNISFCYMPNIIFIAYDVITKYRC